MATDRKNLMKKYLTNWELGHVDNIAGFNRSVLVIIDHLCRELEERDKTIEELEHQIKGVNGDNT